MFVLQKGWSSGGAGSEGQANGAAQGLPLGPLSFSGSTVARKGVRFDAKFDWTGAASVAIFRAPPKGGLPVTAVFDG
jgi:hypothetical protein